jgi:excisionase family DNA binding protein
MTVPDIPLGAAITHGENMQRSDSRPLTAEEVCAICGISRPTLDRYIKAGRGPSRYLINGREYRFSRDETVRWNRSRFNPSTDEPRQLLAGA